MRRTRGGTSRLLEVEVKTRRVGRYRVGWECERETKPLVGAAPREPDREFIV